MDVELQKQLLEILKDIKSSANPVFQELLHQYAGRYLIYSGVSSTFIILALFALVSCVMGFRKSKEDDDKGFFVGLGIVSFAALVFSSIATSFNLCVALYPLGGILGKIQ